VVPMFLGQPLWNFINACFFEYAIAAYDLQLGKQLKSRGNKEQFRRDGRSVLRKIGRQMRKDYLVHPLLSGPSFFHTMDAEGVETFAKASIDGETRGEWYLRQMIGSANITGNKAMHIMTGNLSHQIEHHLFPDPPSNRYAEITPRVQDICTRYGLSYTSGSLPRQVGSAWKQVIKLSLPNDFSIRNTAKRVLRRRPRAKAVSGTEAKATVPSRARKEIHMLIPSRHRRA
jgi:NADPH-dependent stearoyl-CoA 9-desaturase